ncbi:hypothetical protein BDQ17DRAFT_1327186 [Cyathus striatus]|nr:hypothetical protein BDQ17DRAFT_1327186 [Cyathus striatus]
MPLSRSKTDNTFGFDSQTSINPQDEHLAEMNGQGGGLEPLEELCGLSSTHHGIGLRVFPISPSGLSNITDLSPASADLLSPDFRLGHPPSPYSPSESAYSPSAYSPSTYSPSAYSPTESSLQQPRVTVISHDESYIVDVEGSSLAESFNALSLNPTFRASTEHIFGVSFRPTVGTERITKVSLARRKAVGKYKCSYCDKNFTTKVNHQYHINSHTKQAPHPCGYCNKAFKGKGDLKRHQHKACKKLRNNEHATTRLGG